MTFPRTVDRLLFCFDSTRANPSARAHAALASADIRRKPARMAAMIASGSEKADTAKVWPVWIFGAQSLRDPHRFLGIPVVVNEANARMCEIQGAAYFPLNSGIMVEISDDNRSWYACHEMRQGLETSFDRGRLPSLRLG